MLLDSDIFIAIIKEEDRLKQPSLKILKAVENFSIEEFRMDSAYQRNFPNGFCLDGGV